jgi:3-mercaptopropionate dioxygenase
MHPQIEKLVSALDTAVRQPDSESITTALRNVLCDFMSTSSDLALPRELFDCVAGHYARRELYRSADLGYSVIAMTWAPGQGTLLHDHCGMWCVEGVFNGQLEIVQYALTNQQADRFQFERRGAVIAGVGSAGSLIPPHEFHTISNRSNSDVAISLHVYSGCMTTCAVFEPDGDGWYRKNTKQLGLD